jgi:hypothetical protein
MMMTLAVNSVFELEQRSPLVSPRLFLDSWNYHGGEWSMVIPECWDFKQSLRQYGKAVESLSEQLIFKRTVHNAVNAISTTVATQPLIDAEVSSALLPD